MHRTQRYRDLAFRCALGDNALLLHAFHGVERLGRLFQYDLELLSEHTRIDPNKLLGQPACVRVDTPHGDRWFHGIVTRFVVARSDSHLHTYRATLRPWLWMLTRTTDCRIFQDMTVPQILTEVFRTFGFADVRHHLTHDYAQREYCVQYRESAFDFVSRLMEEEGIYYQFEHTDDRHVLVLHDSSIGHTLARGCGKLPLRDQARGAGAIDSVWNWACDHQVLPGALSLEAFDFKDPSKPLRVRDRFERDHAHDEYEVFDYSTRYDDQDIGDRLARVRLESIQAAHRITTAETDARHISTGKLIRLRRSRSAAVDEPLLITAATYRLRNDAFDAHTQSPGEPVFQCAFEALPLGVPYRVPQTTPRPEIRGPQTAIVVGPAGQEIYVDEHARIKVQFHWDRYGRADESSSCWIRVSQPWAGKGYGGLAIPRIGQEVIVEFLEADPDRPIVTGRVYNAASMPPVSNAGRDKQAKPGEKPYPSPQSVKEAAMMTSIRSQSLGGSGGHNEITMNDTAGAEGLFIKAQMDEVHIVGNDRLDMVGNNEAREVGNDRARKVGNNEVVEIGVNAMEKVGTDKIVDVGNTLVIQAGTSITLKCGASMIHMNQAGFITISGTVINVAGAANCNMAAPVTSVTGGLLMMTNGAINMVNGAALTTVNSGGKASVKAAGDAMVQGATVKLN
ncbi:MAG: type VI secretion system tip protein VgrG [Phycisphaeraceae bacterium]|nr:type VI secretion system tip protein VgrG [Phycisphaeraceae bacterium]